MTKRKASVVLETKTDSNQSSSTQDNNSNSTSATNTTTGTNANLGSQNGTTTNVGATPAASGQGRQQQINDNRSNQAKGKKERADNWSNAEIQILHRGIASRRDIFYGPPSQGSKKNRELAWESITKEVNSVSTTPRSLSQVMKKFKNEKCRAKRKFIGADKNGHNNISNNSSNINNNSNSTTNNTNISAQSHTTNNQPQQQQQQQQQLQPQQQQHHLSTAESMPSQTPSINVVKLAPQNVAKTMIDLPGHVQQIQMPNDDNMVLIVQPEMDGLLSGMNIVSDALNNQQHNHHNQHTIQSMNTGSGLVNGTMTNGMMARTIPTGGMCSLVYSAGSEICGGDQQLQGTNVAVSNQLSSNHLGSQNAQNLMHHRGSVDQNPQGQQQQHQHQQQQQHQQLHQHHLQPHQPQQQQQHQQQSQHPQQSHQHPQHPSQHHLQQNHLATSSVTVANANGIGTPGAGIESQLKNLLFNLLLKDGQSSGQVLNQDYSKQKNDMLAVIANSLSKIEGHLSRISKVASGLQFAHNAHVSEDGNISASGSVGATNSGLNMNNRDGNNESIMTVGANNQGGAEA